LPSPRFGSNEGPARVVMEEPEMTTVETANEHDIPGLAALLDDLFTVESDFTPDRNKQLRALRLLLDSPQLGTVFAAREGDDVVGMVSLLYTISTAEGGPACWLEDMVVRHDRRGRGLGSRLLRHAIDHAARAGMTRITLLADGANPAAIRFYRQHGFAASSAVTLRLWP
jgi:GNAT superfamily N-acetyltransferase